MSTNPPLDLALYASMKEHIANHGLSAALRQIAAAVMSLSGHNADAIGVVVTLWQMARKLSHIVLDNELVGEIGKVDK